MAMPCRGCASMVFKIDGFTTIFSTAIPLKAATPRSLGIPGAFEVAEAGPGQPRNGPSAVSSEPSWTALRQRSASSLARLKAPTVFQSSWAAMANSSPLAWANLARFVHRTCTDKWDRCAEYRLQAVPAAQGRTAQPRQLARPGPCCSLHGTSFVHTGSGAEIEQEIVHNGFVKNARMYTIQTLTHLDSYGCVLLGHIPQRHNVARRCCCTSQATSMPGCTEYFEVLCSAAYNLETFVFASCMYAGMHVCIRVCMYVCMYACML